MSTLSPEEQAVRTYHDNIRYLQEQQPRLFDKLAAFDNAVEHGHYEEKYALEYTEEGYFDVKELSTGNYFYGVDSREYAKKAQKLTNFSKEESSFKTFYDYDFSEDELAMYASKSIDENSYYAYAPIMHETKEATKKIVEPKMSEIKKFIFFGVGLGMHITTIDEKVKAENYLIVEDDLELFRLSLFVTNYQMLSKHARLFFCVFEEDDIATAIFKQFLEKSFYYNHYIKYFQMQSSDDSKMKVMHTTIAGQNHLIFLFAAYFKVYLRSLEYLKEGYNFLDMSQKDVIHDTFGEKPVMIVAAGPTLGKNLDWLEKNQDKFVIVALSATLSVLEKRGIKPDVVTHLDPFEKTCMVHIDKLEDKGFIKDCLLFCGSQTPKVLFENFKKENIYIAQVNLTYKKSFSYIEPICVGSATYMMLINLGVRSLYTLGLDLALDSKTGMSHGAEHAYNKKLDISKVDEIEDSMGYLKAVVKIKGNFEEERMATLTFHKSIVAINNFTKVYKKEYQNVYNLNDGAYLEDFIPTYIKDIDLDALEDIDKVLYKEILQKELTRKSSHSVSEEELLSMKRRLSYVQELAKKIEKSEQPQSFNRSLYKSQLLGLTLDILDEYDSEAVDLHNTYLSYLNFILPFIFDMLNTQNMKNEKRYIKKVHKLLVQHCLEIAKHYEEHVEMFFEEEVVD